MDHSKREWESYRKREVEIGWGFFLFRVTVLNCLLVCVCYIGIRMNGWMDRYIIFFLEVKLDDFEL